MISIVIPVFNRHDDTLDCITAIRETAGEHEVEIIVIDNGSAPAFKAPFTGFIPCRVIRNEENKGFPVAVNQGIREANGDAIVLLNNDVIVTPGWIDMMAPALSEFAIVAPVSNYSAGMQRQEIAPYGNRDELNGAAADWAEENGDHIEEVNFVIGFCMAFRRSLYDELGPMDESLWPCSGEEIDFCFRARKAGHRIGIVCGCYVHHEGSQTFNDLEAAGILNYDEICERNSAVIEERWGKDFWKRQATIQPDTGGIRLNMGSGPFPIPGFINIDQFPEVNPDMVADVRDLPFEPGTVSEIYAGHILEHFTRHDGAAVLRYWHSLLKPGGVIGVAVPDYDVLVQQYAANPTPEALIQFNDLYIYSGIQRSPHQYAYSAALLEKVMREAGFEDLQRMPINHPYFPEPVDWQAGIQGVRR